MPTNSVEIVITARDETTQTLERVRGTFSGLGQDIEKGAKGGTQTLELLDGVLRKIGGSSSAASTAFHTLAGAMASPLGAVTSLAGALGAYGLALSRAADEQGRFQRAIHSFDTGTVRGELNRINEELARMGDLSKQMTDPAGSGLSRLFAYLKLIPQFWKEKLLGAPQPEAQQKQAETMLGGLIGAQEGVAQSQILAQLGEIRQRSILFEMQRRINAGDLGGAQALRAQLDKADRDATEAAVRAMRQARGEAPERLAMKPGSVAAAAYDKTTEMEAQRIRAESEVTLARQRIAREEDMRRLFEKGIDDRFNKLKAQYDWEKEKAEEKWATDQEFARQEDQKLAERRAAADAYLADQQNQQQENQKYWEDRFKVDEVQEAWKKAQREAERQDQFEIFDVIRQRAAILGELTPTLQAQLALAEAENLKRQQGLSDTQRETIDARAKLAVLQEMVALDPMAGLRRGFTVVAQAAQQWGTELERVAYETSATMARFFDDSLFNLFTGRKGEDVGRQFAEGLLRSVTGLFSRQLTGYISSIFAQILPRGVGTGGALYGGYGLLQGGAGGGGGLDWLGAGGTVSGVNTLSGLYGGPSLGLTGGGGYLSTLANTPISSLWLTGGTGSAFGTTYGGLSAEYLGVGGATIGSAATGVLAAAALGYTIYSGLTQEQTAANIAYNAVSGAVSGAIVGAVIGSFFGPGYGTLIGGAIGAVIGGAAAGGTTGLKAPRGPSPNERSRKVAEQATENLRDAIDKASSVEDLAVIFNLPWAPHGEVQIGTFYGGAAYSNGPEGLKATPALMIMPDFLTSLSIRTGPTGATALRQDLIDAFRSKRDEIVGILSNIPFGILESDRSIGLTRRTYQPLTALYGMQPGRSRLVTSTEYLRRDLGAEDQTIAFVVDRLREFSVRKDVDLTRQDFLYR